MTPEIKPIIAGNWKMNGTLSSISEMEAIIESSSDALLGKVDTMLCVPATLISSAVNTASKGALYIGAQDCHQNASGAHTGDISAQMIKDIGASSVIVGHSERRTDHKESNEVVKAKAQAGLGEGLITIVCIGETKDEREGGETLDVLKDQLDGSMPDDYLASDLIVAYEPVWAIGTGLVPSADDVKEAHAFMRDYLVARYGEEGGKTRLLYGGSVKPSNAVELMSIANVDGALVGGASLKADDFLGICQAYEEISA